jgi:hypothetical protein
VEKWMEEEHGMWFAQPRPMIKPKKTWREKRLAKEEDNVDRNDNHNE